MAEIRINATGGLKLYDADDSHYAQIVAGTITSNVDAITLGHDTVTIADNLSLGSDSAVIKFGADSEITLTHSADAGLLLKHTATADDKPVSLTLQTGETDIAANDVIGKIDFQAPDEGTGTDAILVAAGIEAVSEGDFSSSNNATKLSFKTAASEAAAEKASLSSTGVFTATSFTGSGAGLTAGTTPVTTLDIDGATDIGAAIVDADLFIIDDGAGGTNRKTTASRLKTYVGGGLAEGDMWRISGTVNMATTGSNTDITTNWERADTDGFSVLGTGLSQSSGIFSFPSTGFYLIDFSFYANSDNAADNYMAFIMSTTDDNSSYSTACHAAGHFPATSDNVQMSNSFILDVTNTTNVKFKFSYYVGATNNLIGDTGRQDSGFTCIKLADT
tara:strand:- start:544 stop:1713 length:1170 start_codon:yes stop_codon:yes gene_type:complete